MKWRVNSCTFHAKGSMFWLLPGVPLLEKLQAWPETVSRWELINGAGKGTSDMDKFGSVILTEWTWSLEAKPYLCENQDPDPREASLCKVVMVPPTPKEMVWRVEEAPWRMVQSSCAVLFTLRWFWGLVSSQYFILMRWMSRWRSWDLWVWCCLGRVDLLMAGGAAEVVSPICSPPLWRIHPPPSLVCCFLVFAEMVESSTVSRRLEVILIVSKKQGGKSHFSVNLVLAVSGIGRFCISQPSAVRCYLYPWRQSRNAGIYGACFADGFENHACAQTVRRYSTEYGTDRFFVNAPGNLSYAFLESLW